MHRLVHKLAASNRFATSCYTLTAIIVTVVCITPGCVEKPVEKKVALDLSKSRDIGCLAGGKWNGQFYHMKGNRSLRISVILEGNKHFDFDRVNHIYADRSGSKITAIKIASFGYSKEKVVERLEGMHQQWNGKSIGNLDKWIKDTEKKGGIRSHGSTIQLEGNQGQPAIHAAIRTNFGGKNDAWYIMTTFSWPRDVSSEPNAEVTPGADAIKEERE